jgi:chemotaxis protein methyltransferase CheR
LANALERMRSAMGFEHDEACAAWLLAGAWNEAKTQLCARHLTVPETYFFREPRAFELLCEVARRKAAEGASLRVWSAGCSTGEEPYSMAMALRRDVPELDPGRVFILATDINSDHLALARAGVYRRWSFRRTGGPLLMQNFEDDGEGQLRVREDIRRMVRFSQLNLAAPVYPSVAIGAQEMDIIFCRNVLMYLSRPQAKKVIERLRRCLVPDGWLIVNPSEASGELFQGFAAKNYPDAIYYRKSDAAALPHQKAAPMSPGAAPEVDDAGASMRDVTSTNPKALVPKKTSAAGQKADRRRMSLQSACEVPEVREVVARARRLADEGDAAAAARCLEQAMHMGPPVAELYHARAMIAMEAGDHRKAMQSLRKALYLKPDFILGHYLLGVLQSAQQRHHEALRQFQAAGELLAALDDDDIVPGSDGLHAAYLLASVHSYLHRSEA